MVFMAARTSVTEWIAQFTLARVRNRVSRVCVPFVLAEIHVAVPIGVHHSVRSVKGIELEVIFPSRSHAIVVVVLIVNFGSVVPVITICVVGDGVGAVLHFLIIGVIFEVFVETLTVWGVGVNVAFRVGGVVVTWAVSLD